MLKVINFLYLISISFWVGGMFFFSFFTAPSIFKVLPRETAGDLVSDIFPKYYIVSYICGIILLIALWVKKYYFESGERFINLSLVLVILMLGASLYAGQLLRPEAAEVKQEIRKVENTAAPEYEILRKKFSFIHFKSVIANIIVFVIGIAIIIITAYNYRVG